MNAPKNKTPPTTLNLPTELRERIQAYGADNDRSMSWIIRKAAEEFLDREGY